MERRKIAIPVIGEEWDNYIKALNAVDLEPVLLEQLPASADGFAGLLLPGGWDIDPVRYGQENAGSYGIDQALDDLQLGMLDLFVKSKKPVLGICRGIQVINVYFGGTLIQHLDTAKRHAHEDSFPGDKKHACTAQEGSWLAGLYGTCFVTNSSHHQAADRPGEGLVIDSRCADDGVVEAVHHAVLPVYGLQWHPERMCLDRAREDTVDGIRIFRFYKELCLQST